MEDTGTARWPTYSTYKSRRIVRSVRDGETYAFADCSDEAYAIKPDRKVIVSNNIPHTVSTDLEGFLKKHCHMFGKNRKATYDIH